jgi:putative glycerol-1-phosphate prenyltransferase
MTEYRKWRHIFKIDPNKHIDDPTLEAVCESGTDAVVVGGTDGVTLDNTLNMLARVRRYSVPCAFEMSNLNAVTPGFDTYFIPMILNSREIPWVTGLHHRAVKEFGDVMNWDEMIVEGYCILNETAKVSTLTNANTKIDEEDLVAYARMAEKMFRLPIFYLEYSGHYGDPNLVKSVKNVLEDTRLFYGGGIKNPEQAREMAQFADTIVVGNVIYEDVKKALRTVEAVKID